MKRLATFLSLATLQLSVATASAQTTFRLGMRAGLNRANTTLADASNSTADYPFSASADKRAIYAWQAGLVAEVCLGKFALQPTIIFSQKGEHFYTKAVLDGITRTENERISTNRYNWLELPINVVYTMHGDHGLQLFAGPYVAFGIGGHQTGTQSGGSGGGNFYTYPVDERINYGADTNNQRMDVGLNFGLGYRQGPLQVQLGYGLGMRDLHRASPPSIDPGFSLPFHDFRGDAAYNHVAQLTGTYFFAL